MLIEERGCERGQVCTLRADPRTAYFRQQPRRAAARWTLLWHTAKCTQLNLIMYLIVLHDATLLLPGLLAPCESSRLLGATRDCARVRHHARLTVEQVSPS